MAAVDPPANGSLRYRIEALERDFSHLEKRLEQVGDRHGELRESVAVLKAEFQAHIRAVDGRFDQVDGRFDQLDESFDEGVKGLRKVLIGAGVSVLIAALTFAITSLAVFGGPG